MIWMLDLVRNQSTARRRAARSGRAPAPARRSHRLAVESLEGRALLSGSSFFAGLFPTFTSTSTTNATDRQINKILRQPTDVTFPPYNITVGVSPLYDPAGTGQVFGPKVAIQGKALPNSTVWLAFGPTGYFNNVTKADENGYYSYDATLEPGTNLVRAFAENFQQNYSRIATARVSYTNPIIAWDAIALRAIANQNITAEEASRNLAILHTAQYDAVAAATNPGSAFAVKVAAMPGASATAAADSAASYVLASLFPQQASAFAAATAAAASALPVNQATTDGLALGQAVAKQTLAGRFKDGSTYTNQYGTAPNPDWSQVRPFVIGSARTFRPAAPPRPGTTAFDQALAEVAALGRDGSATRTDAQTSAAKFWDDPQGTRTNPGHWNAIAAEIASSRKTGLVASARLFARLNVALADAAIAAADSKVTYQEARPQATIRQGDPTWTSLLTTPTTPSYVSEHAAFGAAAADVLAATFGKSAQFTTRTDLNPNPDPTDPNPPARTYKSFAAAAAEESSSRVYGGTNYRFDANAGATLGTSVGRAVLAKFPKG